MDGNSKQNSKVIVYSGERFKVFLRRHGISYKEAAETLGIDKNTVGKVVRGGNMNIEILLKICNAYGLRISDFFLMVDKDTISDSSYFIGSDFEGSLVRFVAEEEFNYKKREKFEHILQHFSVLLEESAQSVASMNKIYEECRHMLDEISIEEDNK